MLCLTFDTDHMDEVHMVRFLESVEIPGQGTFFCTQRYYCLDATHHEIGPHPTLDARTEWDGELARARGLFPEARSWRSHSCVFSHLLAEWLAGNGYQCASTNDQFGQRGIQPIRHPWGVWHLPIYYMDNMDFSRGAFWPNSGDSPFSDTLIDIAIANEGVYVFDFHPIHLLLNTPSRDFYFACRERFKTEGPLAELAFDGVGTRTFYQRLCKAMSEHGLRSLTLDEAISAHLARRATAGSP